MTVPTEPVLPSDSPSSAGSPATPQPPVPIPGVARELQPKFLDTPLDGLLIPPNGANVADVIRYAIGDEERFKRLQRLIWTLTGLITLVLGAASAVAMIVYPHLAAGRVGLAAATIAAGGMVKKAWRWIRQHWPSGKAGGKPAK
jgi:hypothetical protein